jgi:mannose-6-phosphate isomerase-like protein (cupin superfamily)
MRAIHYRFEGRSGDLVRAPASAQTWITIGHTAGAAPWADPAPHLHTDSEELYLVVNGELWLIVAGTRLTVRPGECLLVRPGEPHAVTGGVGPIEHFGMRAPNVADKHPAPDVPVAAGLPDRTQREIEDQWGYRAVLTDPSNQNRWLFGGGSARLPARHLCLAYLNFPTAEAANAGLGMRHRLHYHARSWEYYGVLRGRKTLRVGDDLVEIGPGEILEVPPQARHTLHGREAPFEGFTLRAPLVLGDKVDGD